MKRKRESWILLAIPKPLCLCTVWTSRNLFRLLPKTLKKWIGKQLKIQIVKEYPCFTEDSMVRVYLFSRKPENRIFKKTVRFLFRLCGSALLTYLFTLWIIEQAFLERGYVAYGGELLFIPLIFYIIFKFLNQKRW